MHLIPRIPLHKSRRSASRPRKTYAEHTLLFRFSKTYEKTFLDDKTKKNLGAFGAIFRTIENIPHDVIFTSQDTWQRRQLMREFHWKVNDFHYVVWTK